MGASREHRQRLYEQLVGQTLADRFEITGLLGFGGMGAVYKAVQRNMQRDVAIKVIPSHDPTTTARFEREALTISKLHHPNTVTVFDYGKTGQGMLFLAMEMLSGLTLSDLIEQSGPLTPNRAVHIACQVCRSLYEAHQSDIVHRDVKPDNIFLIEVDDDPDFVKVLDFGIAKIMRGEDDVELTGTGRIIGTPKYMSPEQILAEKIDHRSDIYSLACIVFEMICGSPPFQDTSTTKLMLAHAHQAPPTFSERLPNQALARIPGPLEQVVRRALSKSPMQRQRSIDEFRIELEEALEATDHELRISELNTDGETQQVAGLAQGAGSGTVTDSSDLLSQHSSQTLAKLKRPADLDVPPTAEVVDRSEESKKDSKKDSKAPVYVIIAILAVIGGLVGYMMLAGDKTPDAPEGPSQSELAATQVESNQLDPARADDQAANKAVNKAGAEKTAPAADKPREVELRVVTKPKGAHVYADGLIIGKTPLTMSAEAGSTVAYSFELDGYLDKEISHTVEVDDETPTFSVKLQKEPKVKRPRPRVRKQQDRPPKSDEGEPSGDSSGDKTEEEQTKPEDPRINIEMVEDEDDKPIVDMLE
jgi:serine/threonine-protein kinase